MKRSRSPSPRRFPRPFPRPSPARSPSTSPSPSPPRSPSPQSSSHPSPSPSPPRSPSPPPSSSPPPSPIPTIAQLLALAEKYYRPYSGDHARNPTPFDPARHAPPHARRRNTAQLERVHRELFENPEPFLPFGRGRTRRGRWVEGEVSPKTVERWDGEGDWCWREGDGDGDTVFEDALWRHEDRFGRPGRRIYSSSSEDGIEIMTGAGFDACSDEEDELEGYEIVTPVEESRERGDWGDWFGVEGEGEGMEECRNYGVGRAVERRRSW